MRNKIIPRGRMHSSTPAEQIAWPLLQGRKLRSRMGRVLMTKGKDVLCKECSSRTSSKVSEVREQLTAEKPTRFPVPTSESQSAGGMMSKCEPRRVCSG